GHSGIQIYQGNRFNRRVTKHLPQGQTVTAAQYQYIARRTCECHWRMHQRFMIAIFVGRAELQMPVQEQLEPGSAACDHYPLVLSRSGIDDLVGEQLVFRKRSQRIGFYNADRKQRDDYDCSPTQPGYISLDQWPHEPG